MIRLSSITNNIAKEMSCRTPSLARESDSSTSHLNVPTSASKTSLDTPAGRRSQPNSRRSYGLPSIYRPIFKTSDELELELCDLGAKTEEALNTSWDEIDQLQSVLMERRDEVSGLQKELQGLIEARKRKEKIQKKQADRGCRGLARICREWSDPSEAIDDDVKKLSPLFRSITCLGLRPQGSVKSIGTNSSKGSQNSAPPFSCKLSRLEGFLHRSIQVMHQRRPQGHPNQGNKKDVFMKLRKSTENYFRMKRAIECKELAIDSLRGESILLRKFADEERLKRKREREDMMKQIVVLIEQVQRKDRQCQQKKSQARLAYAR